VSKRAPAQFVERAATRIARLSRAPPAERLRLDSEVEESAPNVFIRYG
jgi:hypothetical protein